MSRNTKEVSLIQHRSGNLAEMPKALHQAEIGLAKDANRLFIGNAVNTILANRTEFPYQNLEILTEYSDLRDHFRYSYENNITDANGETDRAKLKEFMPIVITCENSIGDGLAVGGIISVNGQEIELATGDTIYEIAEKINAVSDQTNTYATVLQTAPSVYLTFFCLDNELIVNDVNNSGILTTLGFPTDITYDISMPERKATEKLDDTLNISDFGIKGNGSNNSQKIFNSLLEVYRNYEDTQFYRNVMFPAGTYMYEPQAIETSDTISTFSPFPLVSNLHVHGEGIDRTIIKTGNIDNTYILVNGVDNQLNPASNSNYGNSSYPANILIEDMTFESTSIRKLCVIDGISNITFNRVKFKGSSSTTLVDIIGKGTKYASNIIFNECIFEGGNYGIFAEKFVENLTITNCTFNTLSTSAIKLGDDTYSIDAPVKACNINGNLIYGTPVVNSSNSYAMEICRNATYISIHQTQFESRLFNNWKTDSFPQPYYMSTENPNAYNFIDTLDPNTDEQKVLRFKFSQPTWEYLDYLVNQQGKKVLVVDKTDSDVTTPNGLHIKETASSLDIRAVGTSPNDVKISIENDKDLILGSGTDENDDVSGNIQIKKTLQLNDNVISNEEGSDDINFVTADDKVLKVEETGDTPYETLINNEPNALTTVAYVKRQIIDTYQRVITYKDLENAENGEISLITFDPIIYGENIHLKRITLNVRTPFYKSFEDISKAVLYEKALTDSNMYFAGDIVRGTVDGTTTYAAVTNTHIATDSNISSNSNLQIIPNQPTYKSVKYANIIGKGNILTQTYYESLYDVNDSNMDYVNIQANNKFGYVSCEEFVDGSSYQSETDLKLVSYCDRNYVLLNVETPKVFNSVDLHNNKKANRKHDEGYCYTFEMDRDIGEGIMGGIVTENYSGETLKLAFYDEDKEQITSFNDNAQLNPGGKLLVRIEFLREEVPGANAE